MYGARDFVLLLMNGYLSIHILLKVMCHMVGHQNSGRRYTFLSSFWYNLLPQGYFKFNWIKFGLILKPDYSTFQICFAN